LLLPVKHTAIACLCAWGLLTPRAEAAAPWHCRVGVGGAFASGFVGILARHGIPYEMVLDQQLVESDVLRRYDLLFISGVMHPDVTKVAETLDEYVKQGGCLVFDIGRPGAGLVRGMRGDSDALVIRFVNASRFQQPSIVSVKFSGDFLTPEVKQGTVFDQMLSMNSIATSFPGTQVWAVYSSVQPTRQAQNQRVNIPPPNVGDAALVMIPHGKGRYLIWGPSMGMTVALGSTQVDALILGLARALTDGRAAPQLLSEGVALSRKQTKRSLQMQTEEEEEFRVSPPPTPTRADASGKRTTLPADVGELASDDDLEFDVSGNFSPSAGAASIRLNYWNSANYLSAEFNQMTAQLVLVRNGRRSVIGSVPLPTSPTPVPFVLQERADAVRLYITGRDRIVYSASSLWKGRVGAKGTSLQNVRYQPAEPVYFSDDFMRSQDEIGAWEQKSGQWKLTPVQNPDMGANPFAFHVDAKPEALALSGRAHWDMYRYRVSARPDAATGQLGLIAYGQGTDSGLLFRLRVAPEAQKTEDGFEIVRILQGKETVLAAAPGALHQGQTYELAIKVYDKWIGGFVDGEKILTGMDASLPGGKIGLWARNTSVKFDDVLVEPSNLREGRGAVFGGDLPSYAGVVDQDTWAGPAMQWNADPNHRGFFWNNAPLWGDVGVRLRTEALSVDGGRAAVLIHAESGNPDTGYTFVAIAEGARLSMEILRNGKSVSHAQLARSNAETEALSIRRAGNLVYARLNNRTVLTYRDPAPLPASGSIAFQTTGALPRIADVAYWSANVANYTFERAPTDWWIGGGEWDVTNRWSCTPDWSWFGGTCPQTQPGVYSGKATIWHKRPLEGDVALDYFAGPKMLPMPTPAGQRQRAQEKMQDFNATLCGDGKDPLSGYAFVIGPGSANRAEIRRNGQVVAKNDAFLMPRMGHNRWVNIRVQKVGSQLSLYFDTQLLLRYDDPQPLPDGYAALWTDNNGMIIPKATLYFQTRGAPLLSLRSS